MSQELKGKLLGKLLNQYRGSVLVFTRTKRRASSVRRMLKRDHISAAEIHSDRTLPQRREALKGFKSGKYRVLVATDIAARGIDVTGIELVVNFDLPDDPESYVHRIGRTGRVGRKGHAISLATADQRKGVESIEKLIKMSIVLSQHPDIPSREFHKALDTAPSFTGKRKIFSSKKALFRYLNSRKRK